jgi:hypothetical protein
VRGDDRLQPEAFIEFADQNQARIRGDARSLKRDLQQPVERELKGLVLQFTHWVSPSVAVSSRRNPANLGRDE